MAGEHLSSERPVLTDRERQCLTLAASGMLAKETAFALGVSLDTVTRHLLSARKKLAARNTIQAVTKALALGLLKSPGSRPVIRQ